MTKKLTDSESQAQPILVKKKWVGHPMNNSDIGYDSEWDYVVPQGTTGPFNPQETIKND
jgi:hypothetical protein